MFIYQGEPVIIIGSTSPSYQQIVASALGYAFYQERGLFAGQLLSGDVTSDDLRTTVTPSVPPPGGVRRPELLFVNEYNAKFGDQGLLTMFADLLDEELDLNSMVNGYAFKTENDLDAWNNDYDYRVTVFSYKGELLIITGSHSPSSHRALADEIARVAYEEMGIEAQQRYSSEVFGALRWAVTLDRARFNSLSYSLGLDADIPFTSTLDFFSEDTDGNTSGALALALVNLSADGQYTLQLPEEPAGEAYGFVEVTGGQITELYLSVDADKIETWSMVNDSLQKILVFDIPGYATSYEDYESIGTLSVAIRIDSIANLNQSYKIDLTREGTVVGSFKLDATDAFPSFAAVRQLSLRGRVFRALGDIQPDGGLVAKGNAGTFVTPIINGNYFLTLFHELTDHIFYSVSGVEAYNSTYPPAEETPFPLEHDLVINQTQRGAYVNLIDVPRQLQFPHFADIDLDGVPDQIDACEDTAAGQDFTMVITVFNFNEPYVFNDNGALPIINTSLADLVDVITEDNTALLASGTLATASGPVTYHQYLRFNESSGPDAFNSGLKMVFGEDERDEEGNFLFANDGDIVFEYELEFENGLRSSLDAQGNLLDLNGSIITLLGMKFVITQSVIEGATLKLVLLGGQVTDTLDAGETKTYILSDKTYEIRVDSTITIPGRVDLVINGERLLVSPNMQTVLADGTALGVIDVHNDPVPSATFVLEPVSLVFTDSFANTNFELGAYVNGVIEDASVSMRGVVSGSAFELNTIKYRLTADSPLGETYIKEGKGLRSETDEPEGMLTPNWDIVFASDNQITFSLNDGVSEPVTGFTIQLTGGSFSHTDNTVTTTTAVDSFGCSCTQKNCAAEGLGCIEEFGQAICAATCTDGVQNGGEAGVDCGMTCGVSCGPNACFNPGQCVGTAPGYCSGTLEVVNNCQQCGCPSTQICTGLNTCANTLPGHCSNGALDGDERGVDCGGSCFGLCPGDPCEFPGSCMAAQLAFCSLGSTGGTLADAFELRGAAGTYYQVATGAQRSEVLDALDRANLNLLIVDAKTEDGLLGYLSTVGPTANPNWPEGEPVRESIDMMHTEGLFVGTRVSVGQDRSWLAANPQDQIVGDWVNLCSQAYGNYISAIVAELAGLGPDVIVLDFFRGPDVADGSTGPLTCAGGDAYSTALVALADRLEQSAKTANPSVQVTLTLFGRIPTSPNDLIGQTMDLADEVDFIMPMLFKSQMSPLTVSESFTNFVDAGVEPSRIKPFIQAFPPFETADEMIQDVNDLAVRGASGFVFWSFIDTLPTSSVWDDVGLALYQVEGEVQAQQVVLNCQQCGCPKGFMCSASGACVSPPPPPIDVCKNGVQDGDERGIDCGGSCGNICPTDQCSELGSCLGAQPLQCTLDAQLQNNCQTCGCPTGFSCQVDGQCTQVLELVGKKCLNGDIFTHNAPMDCESYTNESGYRTEMAQDYLHVSLIGNLPSWWGKKGARSAIKHWVRSTNVCLGEDDYGCVPKEFSCPYVLYAEEARPLIEQEIRNQVKAQGRHTIPSILKNWPFNFHLRVGVDLSKFPLETTYECEPQVVSATTLDENDIPRASTCQPLIENGEPSQKIDILFIGDQMSDTDLREDIDRLLDHDSVRMDTRFEGLFSREPFSSRKNNFNVWYITTPSITYEQGDRYGLVPTQRSVLETSNLCPQRDMVVLITKKPFRSHCYLGYPGPCMISLAGEQFTGRLLSHELGHGLGMLGDEYYHFVEETGTSMATPIGGFFSQEHLARNCQATSTQARAFWGSLVGTAPEIGFFNSCGGDCGEECAHYLRPTINSIMNYQDCKIGTEEIAFTGNILTCRHGPPFRPWYAVNEQQLAKVLDVPAVTPQTSAGIIRGLR